MIIKCKGVLLSKNILIMMAIMILVSTILYLVLPIHASFLYLISMVIMFCSIVYVLYLNRFELLMIGIDQENVHLSFVNNSIYRRTDIKTTKSQITLRQDADKLMFFMDGHQQAILRRSAVAGSDWESVIQAFPKHR